MTTTVFIAIYQTFDDRDPNHWAIFLHDSAKGDVILQVSDDKHGVGYYVEEPMYNKQPQRSGRHETSIEVGTINSDDYDTAVATIQATPTDNESTTWNCQAWVMEALDSLEEVNMFTWKRGAKERALSRRQHWQ
ncbi:hypothetical protein QBC36DRAFT_128141 [Triangularia setosa]|uniref:Uncharacterized protein n=1 Tax=Triangularia setosa TaxID=2587417 RepID=A0AAN7A353_9PEZI|nr:hypothetical protein QBC36DRAFT_128141 [Podospora setosa]